jgi:hypothetical protein
MRREAVLWADSVRRLANGIPVPAPSAPHSRTKQRKPLREWFCRGPRNDGSGR